MNSGICFYSVSVYLGLYLGQISYFEKLSNVHLYCFHRLERRSPGSRKQYGLVIDGASLSLVFKGPYTGKSIFLCKWMVAYPPQAWRHLRKLDTERYCAPTEILYTPMNGYAASDFSYGHFVVLYIIGITFCWFFWSVWTMLTRLSAIGTYIHIHKRYFPLNSE